MSDLFGNTTSIPGRFSPGQFMLESERAAVGYGELFNSAFQSAKNRKNKSDLGRPPDGGDGFTYGPESPDSTWIGPGMGSPRTGMIPY